ncbi:3-methyl-2-oxobutanoate hydroxymethyltransferase [Desulfovibrio litoralis]|uniref:3-methyl-2-oxobutanoate hydroxymethyltransferase n=1 Tax=Desulfovibrio litoralis DSM 11393 TaxID=1121455 RepID=A0A1M7T1R9_9BACT|nr:3-methyl-2-oxobutanoate hydroxymethyltransferase [Desulfovibrio litoralis]SHN64612.1 ketopantoate hydroxymethyltransferase [Desulfovibrio litoralis DSM 11393]
MSTHTPQKLITSYDIRQSKGKKKLSVLTAYDYTSAMIFDSAGVDILLVGDSLGMVVLGRSDTLSVTVDDIIRHSSAVARGTKHSLIVADMPFMSYEISVEEALKNSARIMVEGQAKAVKVEGAGRVLPQVKAMVEAGIPVMGHIGLTPQRLATLGGFKVQGKSAETALLLIKEAIALQDAGCFSIVLEAIPEALATRITNILKIPTIGIGAGAGCDGQVLVSHDLLGLYSDFTPKFVKRYANLASCMKNAVEEYCKEVESGTFPTKEHSFNMPEEEIRELDKLLKNK